MTSIANRMQLIQKLEFNQIVSTEMFEDKVDLRFRNKDQQESRVLLTLQNPDKFLAIINRVQN